MKSRNTFPEARRIGVTRQSIIKVWIAERLEQTGIKNTGRQQ